MSFYRKVQDSRPAWSFSLDPNEKLLGLQVSNQQQQAVLFLSDEGKVGVGHHLPSHTLDVRGTISSDTRIGKMVDADLFADGECHTVLEKVEGIQLFEAVARVHGKKNRGKHAITHALISCVMGRGKVKMTQGVFVWFWDRLVFRAKSNDDNTVRIQVRTRNHYGTDSNGNAFPIQVHITALWETPTNQD
jgi:hypothetical protein